MISLVKELLGEELPKKYFGQNFLIDKNVINKIIKTAEIKESDLVLEVGPGLGFLTFELAKKAKKVVAIEKDKKMFEILQRQILEKGITNVEIINKDVLKVSEEEIKDLFQSSNYRVIANLPYNITSHFLKDFLSMKFHPKEMLLMVQREVAERMLSKPPEMSVLTLSVQIYSEPRMRFIVKPTSFYPSPKVESAIIHLRDIADDKFSVDSESLMQVIKKGFSQKRKQLKNNLQNKKVGEVLEELGYSSSARAQELSLDDWVKLVEKI